MTRTEELRVRLLPMNKLCVDIIQELTNYGIYTNPGEFSHAINKRINGKKAEKIRELTEKIVSDWEKNQKEVKE